MRVANDEKMAHIAELKKMKDDWGKIISPVTYMYGLKDGIVPPVNVEYAREMINNAPLEVTAWPDENHFIPWTQQDSIVRVILKYVNGEGKLK
jgi:pimeloyl-ACP methyl ester carboxylesterase